MLVYSMREEADGILYLFGLSDNDTKKYNTVSNKSRPRLTLISEKTLSMNEEV